MSPSRRKLVNAKATTQYLEAFFDATESRTVLASTTSSLRRRGSVLAIRRVAGGHGSPFCQFPWFDDNVAGVLAPFADRFRQLRYDTWEQFRWDVALEKAAVNFWGY